MITFFTRYNIIINVRLHAHRRYLNKPKKITGLQKKMSHALLVRYMFVHADRVIDLTVVQVKGQRKNLK